MTEKRAAMYSAGRMLTQHTKSPRFDPQHRINQVWLRMWNVHLTASPSRQECLLKSLNPHHHPLFLLPTKCLLRVTTVSPFLKKPLPEHSLSCFLMMPLPLLGICNCLVLESPIKTNNLRISRSFRKLCRVCILLLRLL